MYAMERIRLFVGTQVPAGVVRSIRNVADLRLVQPVWRVAPEEQWHVTALFVGERPAKDVPGIKAAVERIALDTPEIQLHEGRLVTMPEEGPTMLWVRFRPDNELTRLHHRLAEALAMPPSHHVPYWPHITLARSRGKGGVRVDDATMLPPLMLTVLTLFRSEPGPSGTIHTPLFNWPLIQKGPTAPVAGD